MLAWLRLKYLGLPVVGGRYIITATGVNQQGGVMLQLRGWWPDAWFHVANFRPLAKSSQEQDVALFAHHLGKAKAPALLFSWPDRGA